MKNKFAATCAKCAKQVDASEGQTNMVDGKWRTEHLNDAACHVARQRRVGLPSFNSYARGYDDDYHDCLPMSEAEWADACNPNEGSK